MSKDHHKNSFDEGTLTKLDIFQAYAEAWLGIWSVTTRMRVTDLWIWDFFAGPGKSVNGQPGSPLRILQVIKG